MSSPVVEEARIVLMPSVISSGMIAEKAVKSLEGIWLGECRCGGNRCSLKTSAFCCKVGAVLMVARLGGSLGKAFVKVFQRLASVVVSTSVSYCSAAAF